jgi:hypothetical protein
MMVRKTWPLLADADSGADSGEDSGLQIEWSEPASHSHSCIPLNTDNLEKEGDWINNKACEKYKTMTLAIMFGEPMIIIHNPPLIR